MKGYRPDESLRYHLGSLHLLKVSLAPPKRIGQKIFHMMTRHSAFDQALDLDYRWRLTTSFDHYTKKVYCINPKYFAMQILILPLLLTI